MKKNNILKKLQEAFSDSEDKTLEGFKAFDEGVRKLKQELKQNIQVATLDDVNSELSKLKRRFDIEPLIYAVDSLKEDMKSEIDYLLIQLNEKHKELYEEISKNDKSEDINDISLSIDNIKNDIKSVIDEKNKNLQEIKLSFSNEISEKIQISENKIGKVIDTKSEELNKKIDTTKEELNKDIEDLSKEIPKIRADFYTKLNDRSGGGNMNRQIVIGGNASTLSKYTDINLKAGNNVTISYANNETTKRLDVTISATGGSGSVGGVIRSINTINTSQTAGDTDGTDYVYICTAGIRLELPTPVANTNLYTVKNYSASSVLVAGTIDGDSNGIIMPIQYTSVDLISNTVDNYNLT